MMNDFDFDLDLACDVDDVRDDMSDPLADDAQPSNTPFDTAYPAMARHLQALEQENHRLRRLVISLRIAA